MSRAAMMAIGLLASVLTGCASVPTDDGERGIAGGAVIARSVELCRSNIDDLQRRLGPPSRDGVLGRMRVLTWIVDWDPLVRYLGVAADEKGRVVDLYWDLPSEIPWTPADRCR
jgi:hypothetical protein